MLTAVLGCCYDPPRWDMYRLKERFVHVTRFFEINLKVEDLQTIAQGMLRTEIESPFIRESLYVYTAQVYSIELMFLVVF